MSKSNMRRPAQSPTAVATAWKGKNDKGGLSAQRAKANVKAKAPDLSLQLVADEFLYDCQQRLSPESLRSYTGILRIYLAYLRETLDRDPLLSDFTLQSVHQWTLSLQQRPKWLRGGAATGQTPISVESRRSYLRTLRTFSNWLPKAPHCYCAEPPLRHLILPRASDTYKMPLSEDELAQLLRAAEEDSLCGARDKAMLLLLIDGALRAMELASLRIGDVTLQTGLLLVAHGKGNKTRAVTVGKETQQALRRYAVVRDSQPNTPRSPDAPFFQTTWHTAFSYYGLRSWLRRLSARAGVPRAHLHLFRHTSAVETLDVGIDLRTLQLKLGHASITTTQRYLNMASERVSERQREFSPVDRLKLTSREPVKRRGVLPVWRREAAYTAESPTTVNIAEAAESKGV